MLDSDKRPVVTDAHAHLYDWRENTYTFLEKTDAMFQSLIGDYALLPRVFGVQDYIDLYPQVEVGGIVWHEFLSTDPIREVQWAQQLARSACLPVAIVGLVDFSSPELERTLDVYENCQNVTAVRQHLGWDPVRPNRRFAKRDDLLQDRKWQIGLRRLRGRPFHCSLEVFSPQLGDLLPIVETEADIGFTIAVMGWPGSSSPETFREWRRDLGKLAVYPNVRIIISALECVFGMNWVIQDAQAWVDTVFETFGIQRTMFGSHSPIAKLATNFRSPWDSYLGLTSALTAEERGAVLHANAQDWFFSQIRHS